MRYLSNYICLATDRFVMRTVVEFDMNGVIQNIFLLDDMLYESAHTIFVDGIISGELLQPISSFDIETDAFTFIAKHTKPIKVGEKNNLQLWTDIDLFAKRFTTETAIMPLGETQHKQ